VQRLKILHIDASLSSFALKFNLRRYKWQRDIVPCACAMARLLRQSRTSSLSAVDKKDSSPKFMQVARLAVDGAWGGWGWTLLNAR